ncbi:hypothetical protein SAMN05216480_11817 [Pustulibacterium marinum]|uniref:DNA-binding beta-propeller fold protein YncE n=1 Tax=Pustulibacterium marinum TaxID=1224947 RepID=A0A1I7IMR1_9FLAO|nr:YncE family protein [Pustulibacterium marinum]SFU74199.1 hypothetical protein SAMN05216480_11817 [Pustulibacterium marinum]
MKNIRNMVLILCIFCTSCVVVAQESNRYLVAVSKAEHTLSIVNATTFETLVSIPAGPNTHEVVVTDDGKTAYISNPGNSDLHEINVIDLEQHQALENIDTSPFLGPHGLQLIGDNLWFTAQGSKTVVCYNIKSKTFDWTMGTGQDVTHMIHVSPDQQSFYTTNVQSGTISIFKHTLLEPTVPPTGKLPPNAKSHWDWEQKLIDAGIGVEGFDVTNNEEELWAVTPTGLLTIINLKNPEEKIQLETGIKGAHRLQFTPDNTFAVIVSVATGEVVKYEVATRKKVATFKMAQGGEMLMDTILNRVFISCPIDGYIAVVDLDEMKEVGRFSVGARPDGMAWIN